LSKLPAVKTFAGLVEQNVLQGTRYKLGMYMLIQMFFEPIPDDEWHFPGMWTIRKHLVKSTVTLLNASRE